MAGRLDILMLSAGFGFGHHQAAQAVADACRLMEPRLRIETIDYLTLLPPRLSRGTLVVHQWLARDWPQGYGVMYRTTGWLSSLSWWNRIEQRPGLARLHHLLVERRPRLVVATHPMPLMALSALKVDRGVTSPALGIITDYVVHSGWIRRNIETYAVASSDAVRYLREGNRPGSQVLASGIPLRTAFTHPPKKADLRQAWGWDEAPRVLVIAGSQGMRPSEVAAMTQHLVDLPRTSQVVAVAGRHRDVLQELRRLAERMPELTVLPYQDNMHEWMAVCDVVVTKGGALTVSEVMASKRPLVIYRALPGQERGNADWLVDKGAAVRCDSPGELRRAVHEVLTHAEMRERLVQAGSRIVRPNAARTIAEAALNAMTIDSR